MSTKEPALGNTHPRVSGSPANPTKDTLFYVGSEQQSKPSALTSLAYGCLACTRDAGNDHPSAKAFADVRAGSQTASWVGQPHHEASSTSHPKSQAGSHRPCARTTQDPLPLFVGMDAAVCQSGGEQCL
jgi:hypothetical protein